MDEPEAREGAQGAEGEERGARPWLSSVTVGDFPGLEEDVTIELGQRCTVLVGKNGTGKSLLFEALAAAAGYYWGSPGKDYQAPPGRFQCNVCYSPGVELHYEYQRTVLRKDIESVEPLRGLDQVIQFTEACWMQKGAEQTDLWRVEKGILRHATGEEVRLGPNMGRLSTWEWRSDEPSTWEARALMELLMFDLLEAGVPRESQLRDDSLVRVTRPASPGGEKRSPVVHEIRDRIGRISSEIVYLHELAAYSPGSNFEESLKAIFLAVQRIGLAGELCVRRYGSGQSVERKSGGEEWIDEVLLDGVNLGRASDGTCRVLETLLRLYRTGTNHPPPPLLLEEPETGIHPGLLFRLLQEIGAYEGQLLISTHSPQVVSWAEPEDLRLVERRQGKTTVRALAASEVERVHEYLAQDGTLGEFVYSGALDDET